MNTHKPSHTPPRRTLLRSFVSLLTLSLGVASTVSATTYYQTVNQNGAGSWDILSSWNTAADGTGTAPVSINSADDYVCNGTAWVLRTPGPASTFGGKTLTLGPKTHSLLVKSGAALSTIPNLVTQDGTALKSGSNTSTLTITSYLNISGTTLIANGTGTNNLFPLTIGTLTGAGNFNLTGGATATLKLTITDATSYTGKITLTTGKLEFLNAMSSGGALVVTTASDVILNQTVTFTGLTVAGVVKTPGTYTAASLGFTGTGSIIVRTPATWYLTTSQTGAQDWTVAYKTQWNTNTSGTGATAPSINIVDTYSVSVGSNVLRTPATSSTFTGGTLSLAGSGKLLLLGTGTAISSIPKLSSTGGTIDAGVVARNVDADTYARPSGTTTLLTGTGGVLNFYIGVLTGSGGFTISGAGQTAPFIDEANGYTGTITVNTGATLKVSTQLATAGALVVNTGGSVILDDWGYFTALTVNGVVKPVGTHTAASLGFTGAGSITVYTRDLSGPPQMFGVNLAGAEFSSGAYWPDTAPTWDYYEAKGLTLIRVPFKWERIQSTLNGAVNFTKLDQVVALAAARNMKVILDLHNYNYYNGVLVGDPAVPHSALANVWSQIADHFKNEPAIYGYDLMNEPGGTLDNWAAAAQAATNAIRKKDTTHYVFVEGMSYSSASRWPNVSGALDIHDPVGRLIYSAHSYWDYISNPGAQIYGSDGTYETTDIGDATKGVNHVAPFVQWLQTRPYAHGHIGEYGTPNNMNVPGWNLALDAFLAYIKTNNISGTYWAGGAWGTYSLLCEPRPLVGGADKPQMAVLEAYNNFDTWTNQDIGSVITAGNASYAGGTFTVQGAGWDIWNTADAFHFVHQPVSGDCTITARVVSRSATPANSVTGVMIRESLAADSKHALMSLTTNGWVDLGYRLTTAGGSGHSGGVSGITLPYWVRLVRSGNTFKGYRSPDVGGAPSSWVQHGATQTITMTAPTIYVGMPVCGKAGGTLSTATIDNVSVTTP